MRGADSGHPHQNRRNQPIQFVGNLLESSRMERRQRYDLAADGKGIGLPCKPWRPAIDPACGAAKSGARAAAAGTW
jgi:hypothetical protein